MKRCRCRDVACPVHAGRFVCGEDAAFILRSSDAGDAVLEPFCVPCAEDALFTGDYVIEEALDPTDIGDVARELKDKAKEVLSPDEGEIYTEYGWPPYAYSPPPPSPPPTPLEPKEV